jgi:hypothetical protein
VRFGRYRDAVRIDPSRREAPQAINIEVAVLEQTLTPHSVIVTIFSILLCSAVVVWTCALLAIHR